MDKPQVANSLPSHIRPADRSHPPDFSRALPDPVRMAEIKEFEINSARAATSTPRHWQPVDIDEALMR